MMRRLLPLLLACLCLVGAPARPAGFGSFGGGARSRPTRPFLPTDLSGMVAWYKADNGLNYQDSTRLTPATANSDPVGSLTDLSGLSHHLPQASATKRPLLKTNIQNGLACLLFDGSNDILTTTWTRNQPQTFYFVAELVTATLNRYAMDGGVPDSGALFQSPAAGDLRLYAGSSGPSRTLGTGAFHVLTYVLNGSSSAATLDGGTPATASASTANPGGLSLGGKQNESSFSNYYLGEYLTYGAAHSVGDRKQVERYLGTRWGVTVP